MIMVNDVSTRVISGFNYSLQLVWNCMKELKRPTEHFFIYNVFVFISLQELKTPDYLHNKINIFFKKSWKLNGLLLILIPLLNHKNWDLRKVGVGYRKVKVFFHEWKIFLKNSGNELRETLKWRLEWKIKHSPNVFLLLLVILSPICENFHHSAF